MKLTHIDRKQIVAALQSGKTTAELSSLYSVTPGRVTVVYREETGSKLTPFKRLTQREKETIVAELRAKTTTTVDLATRYGVTPSAISYVYKTRVGRTFRQFPSWKLSDQDKETIIAELGVKKATIKELSSRFDVPPGTISKIFRKHTGRSFGAPHVSGKVKETIIKDGRMHKTTMLELADKHGIHPTTVGRIYKQETGKTFRSQQRDNSKVARALRSSQFRAWHKAEKKMYPILGIDWFTSRVLVKRSLELVWLEMSLFILLRKSGLRDASRTPEYPKGKTIYEGDIIQFPILLRERGDEEYKETIATDMVTFDRQCGFELPKMDGDPLALHSDECKVIGTVYENPELISEAA